MYNQFFELLNQLLLPLFVVALLFGICGVSPDLVVRAFASITVALIEAAFKLLAALINAMFGRHSTYPKGSGHWPPSKGKNGSGEQP
jgi:hypothetical protein